RPEGEPAAERRTRHRVLKCGIGWRGPRPGQSRPAERPAQRRRTARGRGGRRGGAQHGRRRHAPRRGGAGGAAGAGGGGGGGGGGRRSDMALKHDIVLLGRLDNGLGFYRFSYVGSDKAYVGVMAQEVQMVMPQAVMRGQDGYLRVFYDKLGLKFESYDRW